MDALGFVLPFTAFVHLLPSIPSTPDLGKMAIEVEQQLKNLVVDVNALKGSYDAVEEIKPSSKPVERKYLLRGSFAHPLEATRSIVDSASDATKLNIDFRTKVESQNVPLVPDAVTTNLQFNNGATWLRNVPSNGREVPNKSPAEGVRAEDGGTTTRSSKDAVTERGKKNVTHFRPYIMDIKDMLRKKFARASVQLETSLGDARRPTDDADGGARKAPSAAVVADNRATRERDYVRLCGRLIGPTTGLMQRLLGRDCVNLLRRGFYPQRNGNDEEDSASGRVGLKIRAKTGIGEDYKEDGSDERRHGDAVVAVDAAISDSSSDYYGSTVRTDEPNVDVDRR